MPPPGIGIGIRTAKQAAGSAHGGLNEGSALVVSAMAILVYAARTYAKRLYALNNVRGLQQRAPSCYRARRDGFVLVIRLLTFSPCVARCLVYVQKLAGGFVDWFGPFWLSLVLIAGLLGATTGALL